jgi:hypothetical protein
MTNVVKLKAPPLKAKSPSSDDSKLIRACVSYAQSVVARLSLGGGRAQY